MRAPRAAAAAAITLVLALLAAELGMRGWLRLRSSPFDRGRAEQELSQRLARVSLWSAWRETGARSDTTASLVFHPYTGSESAYDPHGAIALGARREPGDWTILVTGGSVAEHLAVDGAEPTNTVVEALQADPRFRDRRVRLLCAAHWAYEQPQQLARVLYLFQLGLRPDVVLELDGANEAATHLAGVTSGTHPEFPSYPLWGHLFLRGHDRDPDRVSGLFRLWNLYGEQRRRLEFALGHGLCASCLLDRAVLAFDDAGERRRQAWMTELSSTRGEMPDDELDLGQRFGPAFSVDRHSAAEHVATAWVDASLSLDAVCRARGIRYLHLLQPSPHYQKPWSEAERTRLGSGTDVGASIRLLYPVLRERGRELAARGVEFVDLSTVFEDDQEEIFIDDFHPGPTGSRKLALAVAAAFLRSRAAGVQR